MRISQYHLSSKLCSTGIEASSPPPLVRCNVDYFTRKFRGIMYENGIYLPILAALLEGSFARCQTALWPIFAAQLHTWDFGCVSSCKIFVKQQKETLDLFFCNTNTATQVIWM